MKRHYPEIGLHVPSLLLPAAHVPLATWAVIACDQHTSEPDYWTETGRLVGDHPSTLGLVLPEAFLSGGSRESAVAGIHARMAEYLDDGTLIELPPGLMLVERDTGRGRARRGLIAALDLERYDFREGARELIRSTEGTDARRLPARAAVRRGAPLETPHILVLIDDPDETVLEPLFESAGDPAYEVELMQGGGRVRGWRVGDDAAIAAAAARIGALAAGEPPMLYAMGDGNHSFAAARTVWDELKAAGAPPEHPARFALVELVNLHDDALVFEPIHRLVEGDPASLLDAMGRRFASNGFEIARQSTREDWRRAREAAGAGHSLPFVVGTARGLDFGLARVAQPEAQLAAATLQGFLDESAAEVDFIHGADTLEQLVSGDPGRAGFLLPPLDKRALFSSVIREGATPRKTFSLGEAAEKRYYLECRRISP